MIRATAERRQSPQAGPQETRQAQGMVDDKTRVGLSLWIAQPGERGNALRHFVARLRGYRARFSHASPDTTLHPELSLLDNMLMALEECAFEGPESAKEALLSERLEAQNLRALASWFQNPRRKVHELTAQERLVASVCHALLRRADASLIELTLQGLDPLCLQQLQKTLFLKSHQRHITVHLAHGEQWPFEHDGMWDLTSQGLIPRAA